MLSVVIGVGLVNILKPGENFQIPVQVLAQQTGSLTKIQADVSGSKTVVQALLDIIPRNPVDAAVRALDGEMLALMFFALVFGIALSSLCGDNKSRDENVLIKVFEIIYETCMTIIHCVMKLAPYAVFALVFNSTCKFGHDLLVSLLYYVLVVLLGLAIQQFVVYSAMLKIFTKRSPWEFFKGCREVYLYAFATASSNATLPTSLEVAETKLQLPPAVSRFVLTVGSTANQNGTALFEGVTVLFLAQVYGVHLSLLQQVQVVLMSILAGIGTAGVPGGSLPLIMILLIQMGIPADGMGLILGVDRFLDMCRTTINVSGDLVITALVAEGTESGHKETTL